MAFGLFLFSSLRCSLLFSSFHQIRRSSFLFIGSAGVLSSPDLALFWSGSGVLSSPDLALFWSGFVVSISPITINPNKAHLKKLFSRRFQNSRSYLVNPGGKQEIIPASSFNMDPDHLEPWKPVSSLNKFSQFVELDSAMMKHLLMDVHENLDKIQGLVGDMFQDIPNTNKSIPFADSCEGCSYKT